MSFRPSRRQLLAVLAGAVVAGLPRAAQADDDRPVFLFFFAFDCPHCKKAAPFVKKLEAQNPDVRFESWEVKKDKEGRRRFAKEVKRLGIADPGVPLFVCGDEHVMGWLGAETRRAVREMLARCKKA